METHSVPESLPLIPVIPGHLIPLCFLVPFLMTLIPFFMTPGMERHVPLLNSLWMPLMTPLVRHFSPRLTILELVLGWEGISPVPRR